MLVNCNLGCKHGPTTDVSLDVESNQAICSYCGDEVKNLSSYAKKAMKMNGDILRQKESRAFSFDCINCKKKCSVFMKDGKVVGKGCDKQDCCKFEITDYMKRAVSLYADIDETGGNDE